MNLLSLWQPQQSDRNPGRNKWVVPHYQVEEKNEEFTVQVDLPGVSRSGLTLSVDRDELVVEGRRDEKTLEGWSPVHLESVRSDYRLILELGQAVDPEAVKASLAEGRLELRLAKSDNLKPRKIEVSG